MTELFYFYDVRYINSFAEKSPNQVIIFEIDVCIKL